MTVTPHVGGPLEELLERSGRFFTPGEFSADLRTVTRRGGRGGDVFYRDRWSHDKVVRSTHGVNCTGSCSWKIYVKDGIITWETQQTDYPSVGPDRPEYEPRGCPRVRRSPGTATRPRGCAIRTPGACWSTCIGRPRPALVTRYWRGPTSRPIRSAVAAISRRAARGLIRVSWAEASEMVAAAHVHTIKTYGPDRVAGFTPIPAMSMVSHAAGSRFIELIGGVMTSFYDWYADLPVASPQVFGDQTDVPESGDWWDASYLVMWGSNVPVTRTPDAHWMAEARYRGAKVVVVSPDYADNTKFADEWMRCAAGTDAALAMAMGYVILTECYVQKQVPFFTDFARRYTDLPFLIKLERRGDALVPGKFLTAADIGEEVENAAFKPALLDEVTDRVVVPHGSLGFRFGEDGVGKWNLDLGSVVPALSVQRADQNAQPIELPSFDTIDGHGETVSRGVPARRVGTHLVCTVFDLMLAQYGVRRDGLPGEWPTDYDDPTGQNTPAWQESITGVPAAQAIRIAREFARNAEESGGRSMVIMGGGICHWFHSDVIYRSVLALLMLTGSMGRNGGGWAHYVGQEKVRPLTGWQTMANATDWARPPRQVPGTSYWYVHTDQWRYDSYGADKLASPVGRGRFAGKQTMDLLASAAAMGWSPFYPQFDRSSLDVADEAREAAATSRTTSQNNSPGAT